MKVPFLDLKAVTESFGGLIEQTVADVAGSGIYLRGARTDAFEREYADYIGNRYCVCCGNGLDALRLMLRACIETGMLREGDEVIVPAYTFIATILAITDCGLKPVLVDADACLLRMTAEGIEKSLTQRTRAVMAVHLYGLCSVDSEMEDLCRRLGLLLFEDNAQAHGCLSDTGRRTGSLGLAAAHSFYPGKNLGALGDAGAVTTDNADLARMVRALGNYGSEKKYIFDYRGLNSRIDEIQAAVLSVKLRRLDADNDCRRNVAARYIGEIRNADIRFLPQSLERGCVFHVFPIFADDRDALQTYLLEKGVQTLIHYPVPPHLQRCYSGWERLRLPVTERMHRTELSLPMSPVMTDEEVSYVIDTINSRL